MRRLPSASTSLTSPRRELRSPTTAAEELLGHAHLDLHDRLEQRDVVLGRLAEGQAGRPTWKAISVESTSWDLPSKRVARTLTNG